jgi:hypothetical protein
MMSRLCSNTCPLGSTSTGTVPLGDKASMAAGLSRKDTSSAWYNTPACSKAMRARIA